ncbi:hypothetical protein Cgig2_009100 [Carnegiea gigantea]|uniref:Uncharacterized protein n=1 Tax=Carnegiea gigantea TaxID=171969 RepID=A0A9Q1KEL7_9CARY|nr:hypothetical protein Cgig2_009100 [Carnegiea gigantea]
MATCSSSTVDISAELASASDHDLASLPTKARLTRASAARKSVVEAWVCTEGSPAGGGKDPLLPRDPLVTVPPPGPSRPQQQVTRLWHPRIPGLTTLPSLALHKTESQVKVAWYIAIHLAGGLFTVASASRRTNLYSAGRRYVSSRVTLFREPTTFGFGSECPSNPECLSAGTSGLNLDLYAQPMGARRRARIIFRSSLGQKLIGTPQPPDQSDLRHSVFLKVKHTVN